MMTFAWWLVALAAGYAIGGIPWAYIIGRQKLGLDIRQHGSGNVGATNMWRVGGKKLGAICFLLDFLKGFFPTWYFFSFGEGAAIFAGLGSILGHIFPLWLKGSGGKGVATGTGVFLALCPASTLLAVGFFLVIGPLATRTVSAGAVAAVALLALMNLRSDASWPVFFLSLVVAVLVIYRHKGNIERLYYGREARLWDGLA